MGFVPFSPLGRALLTGAIAKEEDVADEGDFRANLPRFRGENLEHNLELVDRLADVAKAKGCTRAQLSLAWLLAQDDFVVPIPGTKRVRYLEENAAAVDVELGADELERLDALFSPEKIAGERYAPAAMRMLDRD